MNRDCEILALANAQHNTFIYDRAVALQPAQGVANRLGGRCDIIETPDLAEVEVFSEVKPKQIVLQCVSDQLQKSELTLRLDPSATIVNLLGSQAGLGQKRGYVDPRCSRPSADEPRHRADDTRNRTEPLRTGLAHDTRHPVFAISRHSQDWRTEGKSLAHDSEPLPRTDP